MEDKNISTYCRDCVFAQYEDNKQTGCQLGRIELFMAKGATVQRTHDSEFNEENVEKVRKWYEDCATCDEDGSDYPEKPVLPADPNGLEFYVVHNRVCTCYRDKNSGWSRKISQEKWSSQAREEIRIKMHIVVPVCGEVTIEDVLKTAKSLESQKLQATLVHFVLNNGIKVSELTNKLRQMKYKLVWNIKDIIERKNDGSRVSANRCVDLAINPLDLKYSTYYGVIEAGYELPPDFIQSVDNAVNDKLERFILLLPNSDNQGLVVQTRLHQMLGGNAEAEHTKEDGTVVRADDIASKILLMAKDDNAEYLVKKVGEICTALA